MKSWEALWEANFTTITRRGFCPSIDVDCPTNSSYWIKVAKPGTPAATAYFDKLGRQLRSKTIGLDGIIAIFKDTQYDAKGRVLKTSRPFFKGTAVASIAWTTYGYDDLNRTLKETAPASGSGADNIAAVTDYVYSGLTTSVYVRNAVADQITTRTKNSQGQLVSVKDANNKTITNPLSADGQINAATYGNGVAELRSFDTLGRTISPTIVTGMNYGYDRLGNLKQRHKPPPRRLQHRGQFECQF